MSALTRRGLPVAAALATVAAAAGVGLAVPAAAAPQAHHPAARHVRHTATPSPSDSATPRAHHKAGPRAQDPDVFITVRAAGDRTALTGTTTTLNGPTDVEFTARGDRTASDTGTCTIMGTDDSCTITVPDVAVDQTYTITPTTVPGPWFENPVLGVGEVTTPPTPATAVPYGTVITPPIPAGGSETVPVSTADTPADTARGPNWAFSRHDNREPLACGLKVALLFDLSSSITPGLIGSYRDAGVSFVNALDGTPSEVAIYTFGTTSPATSSATADNATLPLTPVTTDLSRLTNKIRQLNVVGTQYTNWDAGLRRIAESNAHYDVVIVLTDGDPTRYGLPEAPLPTGTGTRTRLVDVENGVFSANTVKDQTGAPVEGTPVPHTVVLAVGINTSGEGSDADLRAISGDGDFFTTTFGGLGDELDSLARLQCENSVSIVKKVVPPGGSIGDAKFGGAGWAFSSTSETRETDDTSSVSFETVPGTATTITAHEKPGYTFLSDDTDCKNADGVTVDIDRHSDGFTYTPTLDEAITCTVYNEEAPRPAISITKTPSPTEYGAPDELITYTYVVKNTGDVPLHDINVHDSLLGMITCPRNELGVGESMECEDTHITTDDDVGLGDIHNMVTVTGLDPEDSPVDDDDSATVDITPMPAIQIEKTAFPTEYAMPGEVITYTYRVTNTGNVTLHDISVDDTELGRITCPDTTLAPGDEMECTATHTITAADVDLGLFHNTVKVTGLSPDDVPVEDFDEETVHAIQKPGIQIEKTASRATFTSAGQTITYTYTVANTGNVTLHGVTVRDSRVGTVTCPASTLAAGAEMRCTATYVTTAADVAAGHIPNFAIARGRTPTDAEVTDETEAIVTAVVVPPEVPVTG